MRTGEARGSMLGMGWAEAIDSGMGVSSGPEGAGRRRKNLPGEWLDFSHVCTQQLASDFSKFFEKILQMMDEMARALPNYEDFFDLFKSDQRLHHALVLVYEDILGFWSQATKIFVKGQNTGT